MTTLLITRELQTDSPFRKLLQPYPVSITGKPLVQFSPLPFENLPATDWIFFYSRTAVQFFFQNLKPDMVMPTKMAALGEATAGSIRAAGYQVHFTGNGEPVATAADFVKIAAGAKVLFPQAAHSRSSIEKILHDSIRAVPLVVYDNQAIDCSDLPDYDLLAFTSPLNAGAYWKSHRQQPGQEVYAIGGTTAAALAQLGIKNVVVAEKAGEEGLALAIIKNSYIGGRQKRM